MFESEKYIATPPGATIIEQLEDMGMTTNEFANRMGLSIEYLDMLLAGKMALSHEIADKLEMILGAPAKFWNKLELIYRTKLEEIKRENKLEIDVA